MREGITWGEEQGEEDWKKALGCGITLHENCTDHFLLNLSRILWSKPGPPAFHWAEQKFSKNSISAAEGQSQCKELHCPLCSAKSREDRKVLSCYPLDIFIQAVLVLLQRLKKWGIFELSISFIFFHSSPSSSDLKIYVAFDSSVYFACSFWHGNCQVLSG